MQVVLDYGRRRAALEIAEEALVPSRAAEPLSALPDVAAAVHDALEHPLDYPALRRALTPDDHVAVIVDERLPRLATLLVPLLEHVVAAGISPDAITLLCNTPSTGKPSKPMNMNCCVMPPKLCGRFPDSESSARPGKRPA